MSATEQQSLNMVGEETGIDWSGCDLVEVVPGKVSGAPILKHSRLPADTIVINHDGGSPVDEIMYNFSIDESSVCRILAYADRHRSSSRL